VRLSEVRTDYGLITFEGIGISHKEIRGEIQRISVEYSLWPFALKEIKLEKPDFKVTPETSASSNFGFNRTLAWLSSKVTIVNGKIELKTTSLQAKHSGAGGR